MSGMNQKLILLLSATFLFSSSLYAVENEGDLRDAAGKARKNIEGFNSPLYSNRGIVSSSQEKFHSVPNKTKKIPKVTVQKKSTLSSNLSAKIEELKTSKFLGKHGSNKTTLPVVVDLKLEYEPDRELRELEEVQVDEFGNYELQLNGKTLTEGEILENVTKLESKNREQKNIRIKKKVQAMVRAC